MNLMRMTVIDRNGGVSFVAHGEALPALLRACATNPDRLDELLERTEPYYRGLRERIANGLAMFDERNTDEHHDAILNALEHAQPEESPLFRIVDDVTREASLRPVKAGAVVHQPRRPAHHPAAERLQRDHAHAAAAVCSMASASTSSTFSYRLPKAWALVP